MNEITSELLNENHEDPPEGDENVKRSWVDEHFRKVEINGTLRRECLYSNCALDYHLDCSHLVMKRHWARKHSETSTKPSIFAFSDHIHINN